MPHALIIDCDPGVDDAIALLLALASPELEVLGITTVAGNVGGGLTARNARLVREIAGRSDVPVFAGCERPMVRVPVEAGHFHGESGLGSLPVFEPEAPLADGHAVDFLVRTVMARPAGSVSLAVIGPMTNVAMAMVLEPRLARRLGPVVFMGGARREGGNLTASAEYNVCADPHAAHVVFTSGVRPVVLGLDATHQVRATPERVAAIEALGAHAGDAAAELLRFAVATHRRQVGDGSPPLHDPCTIAWLLRPELFTAEPCRLDVEINSALTLGHTAVEFRLGQREPNAQWVTRADGEGVFQLLTERLGR